MYCLKKISLTLVLCAFAMTAFSQTGTVRGFLINEENGEPMIFANVFLKGTTFGAVTDLNGFYAISKVPAGNYTLMGTYIGFDTATVNISVASGKITTQRLLVKKREVRLLEVSISAKREAKQNEVQISTTKITPKDIEKLPALGGEADIAQYLQVLPGIIFTGDQGGQLFVRGGPPIQTKLLVDGVTLYNPFHSIGLFSVIETDFIKNVEVMTGGFNAEYGGRISAIVDITTKDGNKKEVAGKVSANAFVAKALLEAPLVKLKEDGSSLSLLLSYKNSYLDKTSKTIYSYIDTNGIPYRFSDYYGKISYNTSSGSKVSFFTLHHRDRVQFGETSKFGWEQTGVGTNFVIVPGQSSTLITGNFAYSKYGIELVEADGKPRGSFVNGFNLGMDFTYFLKKGEVKYGFDVNGFKTNLEFFNVLGIQIKEEQNTTELGAFLKYQGRFGKLVIEPSGRMQYYATLSHISLEPRLGIKYNVTDAFRLKLAGGVYSQNLISTKSDRDVVNLFTGFLSGPEADIINSDGSETNHNLQKSTHAILGVELDPVKHVEVNAEPYYIRFNQLINLNRDKVFDSDNNYMTETGEAYGFDLLVKYDYNRYFLWIAYSLGLVERFDGEIEYNPHFDRRHNLNIVASYTIGKNLNYEVSARWNLGSGFPFTKTQGFYELLNFFDGINTNYTTTNGNLGVVYDDELNGGRLPYYHRLDLSVKAKYSISSEAQVEVAAGVTNAYNRENIFYFDRIRYERVNQLPLLPSLGVALKF